MAMGTPESVLPGRPAAARFRGVARGCRVAGMSRAEARRRARVLTGASVILLAGCTGEVPTAAQQRANPASENCVAQGGRLVIETAGDGGEFGVCLFEDNRQCEEWA